MATGDVTLFEEFGREAVEKVHNLSADTIKVGIIDNTAAPTAADATPRWGDYSANEVGTGGNYVANGMTLAGVTWLEAAGVSTLQGQSFTIAQDAGGFTDGYWGIIYNDTATNDEALGFVEFGGPASEVAGPVTIKWNGAAVGVAGTICTHTV